MTSELRFEDVRTGDEITVQVAYDGGTSIHAGTANRYDRKTLFLGPLILRLGLNGWYIDSATGSVAILTAHEPVEPAWMRAQVIKADIPSTDRRGVLLFWVECRKGWASTDLLMWGTAELANVTVIVDEHGKVQA